MSGASMPAWGGVACAADQLVCSRTCKNRQSACKQCNLPFAFLSHKQVEDVYYIMLKKRIIIVTSHRHAHRRRQFIPEHRVRVWCDPPPSCTVLVNGDEPDDAARGPITRHGQR